MARFWGLSVGGLVLAALAVPASASGAWAAPAAASRVQVVGQVVDVAGRPVASALVSLRGSVGLVVTDAEGRFALDQPAGVAAMLVVSAPGFVTREIEGSVGGRIVLESVPVYEVAFSTPARDAAVAASEAPAQAFPTRLGVGLAVRQWTVLRDGEGGRPARAVTGTSLNLLDANGQVRLGQFLVGLSTSRVKTKIEVGGLLVQPEPQPSVEETVVSLSAGPVFGDAAFEWSPS
ncbi:MAG: carboxypeptidase regulatory-like domain-containing protein, partial [Candidatus Sericytochromatia bacterium]|nr:carboxypeptidase regulatory-like domain-containing protein [Candidatus Sericytochromatia bacterium]